MVGQGYTGHAFNDSNHCDATTMLGEVSHNLNEAGDFLAVGIAIGNRLGPGIEIVEPAGARCGRLVVDVHQRLSSRAAAGRCSCAVPLADRLQARVVPTHV